jgi:hypothetical protein
MIISYENSKGHPFTSHGELALAGRVLLELNPGTLHNSFVR